jgi:hypothetical protein
MIGGCESGLAAHWWGEAPERPKAFREGHRPAQGIVVLGHQTRRAAVQHAARSPNELNPGLLTLLFLTSERRRNFGRGKDMAASWAAARHAFQPSITER